MPINLEYPHAECPDCQEPIPDEYEEGDECENCGHVFTVAKAMALGKDEGDEEELAALPELENDTDIPPEEPQEDDITTTDHRTFYQNRKPIVRITMAEYDKDTEAGEKAVAAWMLKNQFYPGVWFVSDHGNASLIEMTEFFK